jgi:hypothetical protein
MEASMRKTVLTIFGALLISGLAVQMAAASEHHARKAYYDRSYDRSDLRGAYDQALGPIDAAPAMIDRLDTNGFGFGGRDPSWVGGKDPSLNPAGN